MRRCPADEAARCVWCVHVCLGARLSCSPHTYLSIAARPKIPWDMQEYGTGVTHLSYAGIRWLIEQVSTTSDHLQLKVRSLLARVSLNHSSISW